jgi:hypothetical protein
MALDTLRRQQEGAHPVKHWHASNTSIEKCYEELVQLIAQSEIAVAAEEERRE